MGRLLSSLLAAGAVAGASAYWHGVAGKGTNLQRLKENGANALRTYYPEDLTDAILACNHGLDIVAGIGIQPNMDWGAAIGRALDVVNSKKWAPCIKSWIVANEIETRMDKGAAFALIQQVAAAVKAADPGRKVTACLADGNHAKWMKEAAPALDYVCVNCYGCADFLCDKLRGQGFNGDYLLGEYGVRGWWEQPATPWGAPKEQSSVEKSRSIITGFRGGAQCSGGPNPIGALAFLDQNGKMEATHTWFPLSDYNGVPAADRYAVLNKVWNWQAPDQWAVKDMLAGQGIPQVEAVYGPEVTGPGQGITVTAVLGGGVDASPFTGFWEIRPDPSSGMNSPVHTGDIGADGNAPPVIASGWAAPAYSGLRGATPNEIAVGLNAPGAPGAYRLFFYIRRADNNGGFATGNLPFLVQ